MGKPAARILDMTAHGGMVTGPGCPTVLIGNMPAARMTDMHVCPMCTGPVPHVGGSLVGPVPPTVFIGKLPAACVGDMAICVGPPSTVLPPGCLTVLIGQAGGGGGGGASAGIGSGGGVNKAQISSPGSIRGGKASSLDVAMAQVGTGKHSDHTSTTLDLNVAIGGTGTGARGEEDAEEKKATLTIKDIVGILEAVEHEDGYETARYFASYLDYDRLTELAKEWVTKKNPPENDPNQMPTRFMLLFGMDDANLQQVDDYPDTAPGDTHTINVANLRKGLRNLGFDIPHNGSFDDRLLAALRQYSARTSCTDTGAGHHVVTAGEDLGSIAEQYGISTWRYLYRKNKEVIGDNPDLLPVGISLEIPGHDRASGEKKIEDKGVDPFDYTGGSSYRYPWVPFSATIVGKDGAPLTETDGQGAETVRFATRKKYSITNIETGAEISTGEIGSADEISLLIPDVAGVGLHIDGLNYGIAYT